VNRRGCNRSVRQDKPRTCYLIPRMRGRSKLVLSTLASCKRVADSTQTARNSCRMMSVRNHRRTIRCSSVRTNNPMPRGPLLLSSEKLMRTTAVPNKTTPPGVFVAFVSSASLKFRNTHFESDAARSSENRKIRLLYLFVLNQTVLHADRTECQTMFRTGNARRTTC
jgi:hypothetical protein